MTSTAIIMGNFQPFHRGHMLLVVEALNHHDKALIIPFTDKISINSPWSSWEVSQQIEKSLPDYKDRIVCDHIYTVKYNDDLFYTRLINKIKEVENPTIWANNYSNVEYNVVQRAGIPIVKYDNPLTKQFNSSNIRELFISGHADEICNKVHPEVFKYLIELTREKEDRFVNLHKDFQFSVEYKKSAKKYDPIFMTADAILMHHDKVLLVTRGKEPGLNKFAFPGGFLDQYETLLDCAVRELKEETQLNISPFELKKCLVKNKVYDDPKRSLRGRVITNAFLFDISSYNLDKLTVIGSDDASNAAWYYLSEIREEMMFEDHYDILMNLLEKEHRDERDEIDMTLSKYYAKNFEVKIDDMHEDFAIIYVDDKQFEVSYDQIQFFGLSSMTDLVDKYLESRNA